MQESKTMTNYMQSLRGRILETAMKAFVARGIKAVKMDDIAQSLAISKRTLYEIFDNKELLLLEGVKLFNNRMEKQREIEYAQCKNVMDMVLNVYHEKMMEFKKTSPHFYADLIKYPIVLEYFQHRRKNAHNQLISFLQRGVEEGYFRKDVELELVATMFTAITEYIMSHQLYKQYAIEQIFHDVVFVSLRGFCTPEGIAMFNQVFQDVHKEVKTDT